MDASYSGVSAEAEGRALKVRLRMENRASRPWRASEGFAVGSQLIDPETSTYIEDGPRNTPAADVMSGSAWEVELRVELPREDGRYRVCVSALDGQGWCHERGWPLVLLEVVVGDGEARLLRTSLTTMRRLRAVLFGRSLGRAFRYPFQSLWRNRDITGSMVWRDILGRYRGSMGGLFWTVLNPLLLILTYYFVFGIVLRTRFAGDPSRSGFVLYFLVGMLPWLAFSEAAGRAPSVMLEHRNFVKRLVFPLETLPVSLTLAGLVTEVLAILVFAVLALVMRGSIPLAAFWLPVLLLPQVMFTLGVCWFLAALGVYIRDLGQVNGFLLTLWFFLTPICYPEASLPPEAMHILSRNPLYVLVRAYRAILLENNAPQFGPLWELWLVSVIVFLAGHACFYRLRKTFADVI